MEPAPNPLASLAAGRVDSHRVASAASPRADFAAAFDLDRVLRVGYVALAVFLLCFLARRGIDVLRLEALTSPRYAFHPGLVRLTPRPDWVGPGVDAAILARLAPLAHCSILHPEFGHAFSARLAEVPWIRSVDRISSGEDDVLRAHVRYAPPVARLSGTRIGSAAAFLDRSGALLPDAGVPLRVPGVRRSDGAPLGPGSRAVAAREIAYLLARTGGKGPVWSSLRWLEVVPARRLDGREQRLLYLWFVRSGGDGYCKVAWGRGAAEARGDDPGPDQKLAAVERVLRHYPGWQGIESAVVFASEVAVRPVGGGVEASLREDAGAP